MEEKKVKIFISGEALDGDTDQDAYSCEGYLQKKDDVWQVLYQEPDVDHVPSGINQLELTKDWAKLHRKGIVSTEMEFLIGEETKCTYGTPYGNILMRIQTNEIQLDLSENGGAAELKYLLMIEHQEPLKRVLKLKIKVEE